MKLLRIHFALSIAPVVLLCSVGTASRAGEHLQSEQWVRRQFDKHKAGYFQLVAFLEKDSSAPHIVTVDVPEYRDLIRKIGAKFVTVREDGSIEFPLSAFGCAICSDSYIGVRYVPRKLKKASHPGWTQTVVTSLEDAKLPHENGLVASGLYVVPLEPEWFIYRFEYQE